MTVINICYHNIVSLYRQLSFEIQTLNVGTQLNKQRHRRHQVKLLTVKLQKKLYIPLTVTYEQKQDYAA